ncbi:MAG: response regulator transcription factor [Anaeromicrobium sp.]|jgi:DNA-binding response OmpR family regulator|uniref:response regulator transcription factor n=1 Tax=Anaeromicrobium sp. TaxID=1929132 RepID=UPI0025EBB6BD|nr:response regulator transcription factor [Anaeromicrobium sp.]MCT4594406.1 response regulator transcription factor [Anaeromicrobium sp.]
MENELILVVDDEKEIRDLLSIYLKGEGYDTILGSDGEEALHILNNQKIDLIILDVMMPNMDGISACIEIRKSKNIPIIILSAKGDDTDKILGLTIGADDYMTKPFNPLELMARVKSQLRRYKKFNSTYLENDLIEIDDLKINTSTHQVTIKDEKVKLTPREFSILKLLAENKGVVFSIEKIYESVWGETFFESDNTVMVHIRKIREKIEENPRSPKYLKTIWGVGYKVEG